MQDTEVLQIEKTSLEVYEDWLNDNLNYIKEELEGYYPGMWDLQEIEQDGDSFIKASIYSKNLTNIDDILETLEHLKHVIKYCIYIYFPSITITNTKNHTSTLTDIYIRIQLNHCLSSASTRSINSYFGGFRSSRSEKEIYSRYVHSHMPSQGLPTTTDVFQKFCLGNTHYSSLCAKLNHFFNREDFTLVIQQLKDYLSWESLEGGPYQKMKDVNSTTTSSSIPSLNQATLELFFNRFLKNYYGKNLDFDYTVIKNSHLHTIQIENNFKFKSLVFNLLKKQVIEQHIFYYSEINNTEVAKVSSSVNLEGPAFKKIFFKFRGNPVKFTVSDIKKTNEDENKILVLNPQITNSIKDKLEHLFNTRIIQEFYE